MLFCTRIYIIIVAYVLITGNIINDMSESSTFYRVNANMYAISNMYTPSESSVT